MKWMLKTSIFVLWCNEGLRPTLIVAKTQRQSCRSVLFCSNGALTAVQFCFAQMVLYPTLLFWHMTQKLLYPGESILFKARAECLLKHHVLRDCRTSKTSTSANHISFWNLGAWPPWLASKSRHVQLIIKKGERFTEKVKLKIFRIIHVKWSRLY